MADLAVVIPTHNRAELVRRAILSALQPGVEVIVVDDASTDATGAVVQTFSGDPVRYHRLDTNRGPGHARNVGIKLTSAELILFLDDDDTLLPGGAAKILATARDYPEHQLYLFACVHSDGRTSFRAGTPVEVTYPRWLRGDFDAELKPVTRRRVFHGDAYEDTAASGEGILWGRVVRRSGALASGGPIVAYNTDHLERLTSAYGLVSRAVQNADICERFLAEFGADLRSVAPARYAERAQATAVYHLMCGRRRRAEQLISSIPSPTMGAASRAAFAVLVRLPPIAVRLAFVLRRRELVSTVRAKRLAATLWPQPTSIS